MNLSSRFCKITVTQRILQDNCYSKEILQDILKILEFRTFFEHPDKNRNGFYWLLELEVWFSFWKMSGYVLNKKSNFIDILGLAGRRGGFIKST